MALQRLTEQAGVKINILILLSTEDGFVETDLTKY